MKNNPLYEFQAEQEERVKAHAHRVELECENMRSRGLDPSKHNYEGSGLTPPVGTLTNMDRLQVTWFHHVYKATDSMQYGNDLKDTVLSNEERLVRALAQTSDTEFQRAIQGKEELLQEYGIDVVNSDDEI